MNWRISCLTLAISFFPLGMSRACTIPVFRYALERWELGPYEAVVFHRGPLSPSHKALARQLEQPSPKANVNLTVVDLGGKVEPEYEELWNRHGKDQTLPALMVRKLEPGTKIPPFWTGTFDPVRVQRLLDSPARQQLVRQLGRGASIVFVLLESGDAKADEAAAQLLDRELANLRPKVQLKAQSADGPQLRYAIPLRVAFSIIKMSAKDPGEEIFTQMLLHSEEDLLPVKGPVVFPIFGRGRLLCSLMDRDLTADSLVNVVRFLCGDCSCQVKELNPGVDLLIAADWLDILECQQLNANVAEQVTLPLLTGLEFVEANTRPLLAVTAQRFENWQAGLVRAATAPANPISPPKDPGPPSAPQANAEPAPAVCGTPGCAQSADSALDRRTVLWSGAGAAFVLMIVTGIWMTRGF